MFFPRLRNQAKWAFVFLIVIFAGGFVFLGVGSGGLDLGQLIRDAFGQSGSSGPAVSSAPENVQEAPPDAPAGQQPAPAPENKGRTTDANSPWGEDTRLRPQDGRARPHPAR